jgi:hypothetical protein
MTWDDAVKKSARGIAVRRDCRPPEPNVVMKGPVGNNFVAYNRSTQPWTRCSFSKASALEDWAPYPTPVAAS